MLPPLPRQAKALACTRSRSGQPQAPPPHHLSLTFPQRAIAWLSSVCGIPLARVRRVEDAKMTDGRGGR